MSTAELYITDESIAAFVAETRADYSLTLTGEEGKEYGISPYITFYIYHTDDDFPRLSEAFIDLYQELQTMIDEPFLKVYNGKSESWRAATPKNLGREILEKYAKTCFKAKPCEGWDGEILYGNKTFRIKATSEESPAASALWAISACATDTYMNYSTVKITFRDKWYRREDKTKRIQNKTLWHEFVKRWIARLHPEHCYSGYEIGTTTTGIMGAYESDVMERICADYFYGLDVDHPFDMGFHNKEWEKRYEGAVREYGKDKVDKEAYKLANPARLGAGLRTPTWCFLLSPLWRGKLGKSIGEVKAALRHPDVRITEIPYPAHEKHNPGGEPTLWIQLGELNLYPVEEGVPELPVIANRLIRPIRANLLQLYTLDPWEGDPNPRFDFENSPQWMARFDEDSDWPKKELRKKPPKKEQPEGEREEDAPSFLQCRAGAACPRSGYWRTPARLKLRRKFAQGEIMPEVESATHGTTVWHWDKEQA